MSDLPEPKCRLGYTIEQVESILGPNADLDAFGAWMYGQTMAICEGYKYAPEEEAGYREVCGGEAHGVIIYPWDLARYIEGRPVVD